MSRRRPADLLELIEATPPGQELWVRGAGRSLYPLLRSGDSVKVLRCAPEELVRGDVALVRVGRRAVGIAVHQRRLGREPRIHFDDAAAHR